MGGIAVVVGMLIVGVVMGAVAGRVGVIAVTIVVVGAAVRAVRAVGVAERGTTMN